MFRSGRFAVLVLCVIAMLAVGVAGGAVGDTAGYTQTATNETDEPPHEHPDEAAGEGDAAAVADWLAGELGTRLGDSAIEISDGQYEQGSSLLGEDYEERLEQYVEVAGETGRETPDEEDDRTADERAAEEYGEAREKQAELATLLQEYEATLAEYEAARDAGETDRARELARELLDLGEQIEALGGELSVHYTELGRLVDQNLTEARNRTLSTTNETAQQANQIAGDVFVGTTLTVATSRHISFRDPLEVEGLLFEADGTPIENATIAVTDPAGATVTQTDDDGSFSLTYRPVLRPVTADTVTIEYRPEPTAPYQAATSQVNVSIEQATGALSVEGLPDTASFGDRLEPTVTTTIDDEPVGGVPVLLLFGGKSATATTTRSGSIALPTSVTAGLQTGERPLTVSVPVNNTSVAFDTIDRTVTVTETQTILSVDADRETDTEGLLVTGRLTAETGAALSNQTVAVSVAERDLQTVTTGTDGQFNLAVTDVPSDDSFELLATYDGTGRNLASSQASITVPAVGTGLPLSTYYLPLGVAMVVLLITLGLYLRLRVSVNRDDEPERPDSPEDDTGVSAMMTAATSLKRARQQTDTAPDTATRLAYAASREALASDLGVDDAVTHWEFYRAGQRDGLESDTVSALRDLTEAYERAAFAPGSVGSAEARSAIEAAEQVLP